MMYDSWDMNPNRQNFLSFWAIFFPFTPLTTQKIKMLKNRKKGPGDIIISHKCTKNHDNMLHCSWDVEHDRFNYFSFWAIFCPFTYLTALKIKIKKKMKKSLEISFYKCVPKIMIRWSMVPEIWCAMDRQMDRRMDRWTDRQSNIRGGCST